MLLTVIIYWVSLTPKETLQGLKVYEWMNEWMNECLTTPQRKEKLAIGCQTKVNESMINNTVYEAVIN